MALIIPFKLGDGYHGDRGPYVLVVEIPLELQAIMKEAEEIRYKHGPVMETQEDVYERMIEIILDGYSAATCVISCKARLSWYRRLWLWLTMQPRPVPDFRIGSDIECWGYPDEDESSG
jgi:hypothetical protein